LYVSRSHKGVAEMAGASGALNFDTTPIRIR
jgi:hypothetical protein